MIQPHRGSRNQSNRRQDEQDLQDEF